MKALHLVTTRLSSTSANYPVKKLQQQQAGQGSNVPLQDQLASVNQQGDSSPVQVFSRFRLFRIGPLLSFILVYPIASYHPLALLFEGATVVYLYRSGNLRLLIPFVLLVFFFLFVYESVWHLFMLWITLLLIFWISWDNPKVPATSNFHKAVALLLFVVGLLQVAWTVAAIRYERKQATYPARATADYLKTLPSSEQIAGVGFADTVRPYFLNSILNAGYAKKDVSNVLVGHPDIILVDHNRSAEDSRLLLQSGYRQTHTFCGAPYFPNLPLVPVCLTTYERFNHVQINGFTQP